VGLGNSLDEAQRRHSVLGVPIAVFYKFVDDQGPYLAAIISFYALLAIFPLLLLATSIFGFVLQGNPDLQEQVLDSTLATFPIIGEELGRPDGLQGSTAGVIVGSLAALYGSLGLATALQNALNVAWTVPRNNRPNPIALRLKSLLLMTTTGLFVMAVTIVSLFVSEANTLGTDNDPYVLWLTRLANVVLIGLLLTIVFRFAAARRHHIGRAAPGAFTVAVLWLVLQLTGTWYTKQVIAGTEGMNATFGLVLGLIGLIYFAAFIGVIGIEVNVVLERRLWPRALMTLFTDKVSLTEADRRAYASYAWAQQHKAHENVEVSFTDPDTGEVHVPEEPLPLRRRRRRTPAE
jgi:membrane protein